MHHVAFTVTLESGHGDNPVGFGEECVILTHSHVGARPELLTPLSDENITRNRRHIGPDLDAEASSDGIPTVARRAAGFLGRHRPDCRDGRCGAWRDGRSCQRTEYFTVHGQGTLEVAVTVPAAVAAIDGVPEALSTRERDDDLFALYCERQARSRFLLDKQPQRLNPCVASYVPFSTRVYLSAHPNHPSFRQSIDEAAGRSDGPFNPTFRQRFFKFAQSYSNQSSTSMCRCRMDGARLSSRPNVEDVVSDKGQLLVTDRPKHIYIEIDSESVSYGICLLPLPVNVASALSH